MYNADQSFMNAVDEYTERWYNNMAKDGVMPERAAESSEDVTDFMLGLSHIFLDAYEALNGPRPKKSEARNFSIVTFAGAYGKTPKVNRFMGKLKEGKENETRSRLVKRNRLEQKAEAAGGNAADHDGGRNGETGVRPRTELGEGKREEGAVTETQPRSAEEPL